MNDPKQHSKPSNTHQSNNPFSGGTPFFAPKNPDVAPKERDVVQAKGLFSDQPAFFQPAQAKLKIGQPGDKYEQEADSVADQVVSQGRKLNTSSTGTEVQRSSASEEQLQKMDGDEDVVQSKILGDSITPLVQRDMKPAEELQKKESEEEIQAKEEEPEALQAKEEEKSLQTKTEDDSPVAMSGDKPNPVQRCADCDEVQAKDEDDSLQAKEEEREAPVQMSGGSDESGSSSLESQLSSSKGGGRALDEGTRSQMESGFGKDFNGVRVHDGADAVKMNQSLGAQAFTHGNDIYFNEGKYKPGSEDGDRLLAHELTHTVQQGASTQPAVQQKEKDPKPEIGKPGSPLDITHRLELTKEWADYLDAKYKKGERSFEVDVKIGERYSGTIKVRKLKANETGEIAKYDLVSSGKQKYLDINGWSFLDPLRASGVTPILVLNPFGEDQTTKGFLSMKIGDNALTSDVLGFIKGINQNLEQMRFLGIKPLNVDGVENNFESGRLVFQVGTMNTVVDGFLEAGGGMGISGDAFTFNLSTKVDVAGLIQGEFTIARGEDGALSGSGDIETQIANVQAKVHVEYLEGIVTIQGTGRIESDKFSGEITLLVTDAERSKQMMHAALGVESMDAEQESAETTPKPKAKGNQVLAGWGEVKATITPWLEGTAKVGIDAEGHVTIVGEIAVPNQIELMEQRGKKVDIFKLEIRAGYGIPLVGQVFLFASIGMFMNAGFGPLVLKDVAFTGTYSTDPSVLQEFSITGTLGINAFAILGLEAEAGVGLTLLGHDVKAGVNVTAAAGLRAYAEATPTLQYSEQASPEGGKVGETHLKGHFEAAAQLFAQLSGAFFVEIDAPWWSPVSDGREEYPLGEVQYPIGDTMGIGADMDWLVGSPDIPEVKFSPVEFDADKFTSDIMADPPPRKYGKSDADEKGEWVDGNAPGEQKENPELKDGEGLPENDKKKEDLKNLPDEEKYMRSLDEMSKLEKASPKPTLSVVNAKAAKVKAKYGLDKITVKDKDDKAEIFVKHKKEDNGKHLLMVPLMSEAERMKLLAAAMDDLNKKSDAAASEDGTIEESKAKELLATWKKANPIIDEAHVKDGEQTWDYFIDLGDKSDTVKGKLKKGDPATIDPKKVHDEFTLKSGEEHKIYLRPTKDSGFELIMESTPTLYEAFINQFKLPENASEELKTLKTQAQSVAKELGEELHRLTTGSEKAVLTTEQFDAKVAVLSDYTKQLMDASYGPEIPENQITFGPKFDGAFGSSVSINYISSKSGGEQSSSIPYDKHGVLDLRKGESGKRPYYLRGHLLNANLHGPNDWKNLTPLTYSANSNHKSKVESKLTSHLTEEGVPLTADKRVFKYIVIAQYGRGVNSSAKSEVDKSTDPEVQAYATTIKQIIDAEAFVPKFLQIKAIELKPNAAGKWVEETVVFDDKIPNDIEQTPKSYNVSGTEKEIATILDIDEVTLTFLNKWFNSANSDAIMSAIEDDRLEISKAEDLQSFAMKKLNTTDKRKIPLSAIIEHIKF